MGTLITTDHILASLLFAGLGIAILILSFVIVEKLTVHNLYKEIVHNKNVALALIASAYMLAVAIIIASAIH